MDIFKWKKVGLFAGGVLFGTAGIKILSSQDAKKFYVNAVAAALRARECVLDTAAAVQENAEDILEEAQQINEDRNKEQAARNMELADTDSSEVNGEVSDQA